jgi:hypothetical protein
LFFIFGAHQIGRFGERQKFDLPAQQIRLMREKWFCDALHADCGELRHVSSGAARRRISLGLWLD